MCTYLIILGILTTESDHWHQSTLMYLVGKQNTLLLLWYLLVLVHHFLGVLYHVPVHHSLGGYCAVRSATHDFRVTVHCITVNNLVCHPKDYLWILENNVKYCISSRMFQFYSKYTFTLLKTKLPTCMSLFIEFSCLQTDEQSKKFYI